MAVDLGKILASAGDVLAAQEQEVAAGRARNPLRIACRTATGTGSIDHLFKLDRMFRLIYIRCHFVGTPGRNPFTLGVDAAAGSNYDAALFTINRAGTGRDVHFRLTAEEAAEPSAWTFQTGDAIRVRWTNPDAGNITWGLEVGLAPSS